MSTTSIGVARGAGGVSIAVMRRNVRAASDSRVTEPLRLPVRGVVRSLLRALLPKPVRDDHRNAKTDIILVSGD
jgi:hypothetical protein